jgi:hypothetical protein
VAAVSAVESADDRLERWKHEIQDIWNELAWVRIDDRIFQRTAAAVERHGDVQANNLVMAWMTKLHARNLVLGLRRLVSTRTDDRSMVRLLLDIERHASDINVSWFERSWQIPLRDTARREFAELIGSCTATELSSVGVKNDIDALRSAWKAHPLSDLANKVVAHWGAEPPRVAEMRWTDVETFADLLETHVVKYYRLLLGSVPISLLPAELNDDVEKDLVELLMRARPVE